MTVFERATEIPCSAAALFRYHAAGGAFARLSPPFESAQIVVPLRALENGERAEIDVGIGPLTFRHVALHQEVQTGAAGGAAGFVDVMERGPFRSWRHEHVFEPIDSARCRLIDRITFQGPVFGVGDFYARSKLERMFRYRHDTTRLDAELLRALPSSSPLRIGVTGSRGLIGTELCALLSVAGHVVVPFLRPGARPAAGSLSWDPATGAVGPVDDAAGLDAVVHLAGENIGEGRFDAKKKARVRRDRVEGTARLMAALRALPVPPRVVVCAGAVGFYGDRGDDVVDEDSAAGSGFLAELCAAWEAAVLGRDDPWRAVVLRIGIAQSPASGALAAMLPVFRAGVGGPIGDGRGFFPALALDDVAAMFARALLDPRAQGIINAVGADEVRSGEYARTLGRVLHRPAVVPVPTFALRAAVGDLAEHLRESQRVAPTRLRALGHTWRHATLEDGLRHLLGRH
ncbi:MAG: TIGR01777 family oxidoreductase [Deltaproteobacteria bacterium]|nr:TIGR01777 family oxidoreductase [Deltaproteobacteria bacterium]